MKLYAYPHVVQQEIIRHLTLVDILIFSNCSKNHKQFLQIVGKCCFPKVEKLVYTSHDTNSLEITEEKKLIIMGRAKRLLIEPESKVGERSPVKMRLFGMDLMVCFPIDQSKPLTIFCSEENGDALFRSLHNLIYDLLGSTTTYALHTKNKKYLAKLKHITYSAHNLDYSEQNIKELEEFIAVSPELVFMDLTGVECGKFLIAIPKIARIQSLNINGQGVDTMEIIQTFRGKHLSVVSHGKTDEAVAQFLKNWKSGEGLNNKHLKSLTLTKTENRGADLNRDIILENLEIKAFDHQEMMLSVFKAPTVNFFTYGMVQSWKIFSTDTYIVLDSDKQMGVFLLMRDSFTFVHFNTSEKEFLEKLKKGEI